MSVADVTICVLTYGDYPALARRAVESIRRHCPRSRYELFVGANAASQETGSYLESLQRAGDIDRLIQSEVNLNKNPMMRLLFREVRTEFIWWFDDDSYITDPDALDHWVATAKAAPESTALWGSLGVCNDPLAFAADLDDVLGFVRSASWYRGLPPPSWKPGGKGELDFEGRGTGDGQWFFIFGGCGLYRTRALAEIDWPDKRLIKMGEDVFLGEAVRQQGWSLGHIEDPGVAINTEARRGDPGLTPEPAGLVRWNQPAEP